MTTTRRDFLGTLLHVSLIPLVGAPAGCSEATGGGSDSLRDGGPTACASITVLVGANHGHVLAVPLADVQAGNSKTYRLSSNGSHSHTVRISNADFVQLANGATLSLTSTDDAGHAHGVTVGCVALSGDAGVDSGTQPDDAGSDGGPQTADAGSDAATPSCTDVVETIGTNHGHTLVVPAADVLAGVETSYTLTSNGSHAHTLLVTSTDFATLAAGGTVTKASATTPSVGHEHSVTLLCG